VTRETASMGVVHVAPTAFGVDEGIGGGGGRYRLPVT
jgi:hypothetical protein